MDTEEDPDISMRNAPDENENENENEIENENGPSMAIAQNTPVAPDEDEDITMQSAEDTNGKDAQRTAPDNAEEPSENDMSFQPSQSYLNSWPPARSIHDPAPTPAFVSPNALAPAPVSSPAVTPSPVVPFKRTLATFVRESDQEDVEEDHYPDFQGDHVEEHLNSTRANGNLTSSVPLMQEHASPPVGNNSRNLTEGRVTLLRPEDLPRAPFANANETRRQGQPQDPYWAPWFVARGTEVIEFTANCMQVISVGAGAIKAHIPTDEAKRQIIAIARKAPVPEGVRRYLQNHAQRRIFRQVETPSPGRRAIRYITPPTSPHHVRIPGGYPPSPIQISPLPSPLPSPLSSPFPSPVMSSSSPPTSFTITHVPTATTGPVHDVSTNASPVVETHDSPITSLAGSPQHEQSSHDSEPTAGPSGPSVDIPFFDTSYNEEDEMDVVETLTRVRSPPKTPKVVFPDSTGIQFSAADQLKTLTNRYFAKAPEKAPAPTSEPQESSSAETLPESVEQRLLIPQTSGEVAPTVADSAESSSSDLPLQLSQIPSDSEQLIDSAQNSTQTMEQQPSNSEESTKSAENSTEVVEQQPSNSEPMADSAENPTELLEQQSPNLGELTGSSLALPTSVGQGSAIPAEQVAPVQTLTSCMRQRPAAVDNPTEPDPSQYSMAKIFRTLHSRIFKKGRQRELTKNLRDGVERANVLGEISGNPKTPMNKSARFLDDPVTRTKKYVKEEAISYPSPLSSRDEDSVLSQTPPRSVRFNPTQAEEAAMCAAQLGVFIPDTYNYGAQAQSSTPDVATNPSLSQIHEILETAASNPVAEEQADNAKEQADDDNAKEQADDANVPAPMTGTSAANNQNQAASSSERRYAFRDRKLSEDEQKRQDQQAKDEARKERKEAAEKARKERQEVEEKARKEREEAEEAARKAEAEAEEAARKAQEEAEAEELARNAQEAAEEAATRLQDEAEEEARREEEEEEARKQAAEDEERNKRSLRIPRGQVIQPLTEEWEQKVIDAVTSRSNTAVGRSIIKGNDITRRDIRMVVSQVRGSTPWLNDAIIDFYLEAVVHHGNAAASTEDGRGRSHRGETPKFHAFNPAFYNKLRDNGPESIRRWTRRAKINGPDLLKVEWVFIPVNMHGNHWTLLAVSPTRKTIEYYDSLHGRITHQIAKVKAWLKDELKENYINEEWQVLQDPRDPRRGKGPRQSNGSDCGVFTVTTAKMITLGVDPMAVTAADMPTQRMRIIAELMNGGFHGEFAPDIRFE